MPFSWSPDQLDNLCKSWELAAMATSTTFSCDKTVGDQVLKVMIPSLQYLLYTYLNQILSKIFESIGALAITDGMMYIKQKM